MSFPVPSEQTHLTHPKYRADIDGLRAIAVLSVVGFHGFPNWIKGGFVGVDIFFVISGFLISSIIISSLEKATFSFTEFYARRIKRIFPALIFVMAACFVFGWFVLLPYEYKQLGKHIAAGAGFVSNLIFWQEAGYFDNAAQTKPLLHLWSLGIEEQFYIVWPLLLYLLRKQRSNVWILAFAIVVISFTVNVDIRLSDRVQDFYSPLTRFWELMMGSILAYLALNNINLADLANKIIRAASGYAYKEIKPSGKLLNNAQSFMGGLLIVGAALLLTKDRLFPGWWALLPTAGAYLIISAGQHAWLNRTLLSHRIVVWFGLISYPLYLWHWPLLSFARILELEMPTGGIRIAAVLFSIVLAWLTYRMIEKPIRFGNYSKAKTVTLLLLMIIVGYVGYNSYLRDGLGFRFPKIIQEITQPNWYKGDAMWEKDFCFLKPDQDYTAFADCESKQQDATKPSLLLWGDSHAARLIPGYRTSYSKNFIIIPRTASACPPIINVDFPDRPSCRKINDYVFEYIKKKRPEKIVLEAAWPLYDWENIQTTITQIRKLGITNIDLIGPVPEWVDGLPKQLYLYYRTDKSKRLPKRMNFGLNKNFIQIDHLMADFARSIRVNYISPATILCDKVGCITRFGETGDSLSAFDSAHLTDVGSIYLVSKFQKN